MSVNLYNAERYLDPTAYEALMNIERAAKRTAYKPLVFICSPFAGNIERNTRRARDFCRFAVSENCIPIAPHLLFPQFMEESDPEQRRLGIFFGLVLQSKCKEVWVFGQAAPAGDSRTNPAAKEKNKARAGTCGKSPAPVVITKGMAVEIEKAHERGLPVRYFTERCVEVVRK